MKIEIIEPELIKVGEAADRIGIDALIVGGFVRDHFLKRPRNDYDITVVGDPISFANELGLIFKKKVTIFERFRTAHIALDNVELEIVGTRSETYVEGNRNPIVKEGTLKDDIDRRDFTINSMAAYLNKSRLGELVDLHNGINAINEKKLNTPLDPDVTFKDDPLRILRAVRFASQLGFKFHSRLDSAIFGNVWRLKDISDERVTTEIVKILMSPKPSIGFELLSRYGILNIYLPEVERLNTKDPVMTQHGQMSHKNNMDHTFEVLDNVAEVSNNLHLRLVALLHDIGKTNTKKFSVETGWTFQNHEQSSASQIMKIFKRLKLPLIGVSYIEKIIKYHGHPKNLLDEFVSRSALRRISVILEDELEDLFTFVKCDLTTKDSEKKQKFKDDYDKLLKKILKVKEDDNLADFKCPIDGNEIMKVMENNKPGRWIKDIKDSIENSILDGSIKNDYDSAMVMLKRIKFRNDMNWHA